MQHYFHFEKKEYLLRLLSAIQPKQPTTTKSILQYIQTFVFLQIRQVLKLYERLLYQELTPIQKKTFTQHDFEFFITSSDSFNDWIKLLAVSNVCCTIFAFLKCFSTRVANVSRGVMVEFNMGPQIGTTGKVKLGTNDTFVQLRTDFSHE